MSVEEKQARSVFGIMDFNIYLSYDLNLKKITLSLYSW